MKTNASLRTRATWCFAVTLLLGVWGTGRILLGQSEKKAESKSAAEVKIGSAAAEKPQAAGKRGVATTDPIEILRQGGVVMYPLLACSVVGLALFFERLVSLRRSRVIPKPFVQRFLHQVRDGNLDRQRALELCQENRSPVAAVFAGAAEVGPAQRGGGAGDHRRRRASHQRLAEVSPGLFRPDGNRSAVGPAGNRDRHDRNV